MVLLPRGKTHDVGAVGKSAEVVENSKAANKQGALFVRGCRCSQV